MFKKISRRKTHFIILAFLCGLFIGSNFSFIATAGEPAHKFLDYFHRVYQLIRTDYVDETENKKIFYGAIKGMIKSLDDPFSRFLDEKSFNDLKEMTTGKYVGVGIVITIRDDEIVVISPIDDSPAHEAGILAGDVITRVNGTALKGKKLTEVVKLIKGLPRTKVKLTIRRTGFDETMEYEIERKPIKIKSVSSATIKDKKIGYIKIKSFGSDTTGDVSRALKKFNREGIKNLIIDLRFNPGGLLQAAVGVSDLLLEKGQVIVSTRGRAGSRREQVFKSLNDPVYTGEVVILVNRGSASASEILSGAVRDNKRGKLLGEKTFGKGSVQKTYNLDKKVGVAITIAKYYTPSGGMIHKKGIVPDFIVESQKMSKKDSVALKKINSEKLLAKFVTRNMRYNEESRNTFAEFLKKKGIELSKTTADFILKTRITRFKKQEVYDLEFDTQLNSAIEKLTGMK
jgi:carboxyl-terminal processing protease